VRTERLHADRGRVRSSHPVPSCWIDHIHRRRFLVGGRPAPARSDSTRDSRRTATSSINRQTSSFGQHSGQHLGQQRPAKISACAHRFEGYDGGLRTVEHALAVLRADGALEHRHSNSS
jgi:hypothetical protein